MELAVVPRIRHRYLTAEEETKTDVMLESWVRIEKTGAGWHSRLSNAAITGHAADYVVAPKPRTEAVDLCLAHTPATGEPYRTFCSW